MKGMGTMKKRSILAITAVLLFILSSLYQAYAAKNPLGMVTGIYGKLLVLQDRKEVKGFMRMPLYKDDQLITDTGSKATILLKDNSEIKMAPGTKITIQEKAQKRGLLVTIGKIFAKMMPQKNNFEITSPHGAAAIEGTELQYEVASGKSSVVVADGKVKFGNKKNSVGVSKSMEGVSSSMTNQIGSPLTVEYRRLIRWSDEIVAYKELIERFMANYQSAVNKQQASVAGSLIEAQKECEEMKRILDKLQSMTPDPLFSNGHRYLADALANYKTALLFYQEPAKYQDFVNKGNASYSKAETQFRAFTDAYNDAVNKMHSTP
jgi:hypothetical protein